MQKKPLSPHITIYKPQITSVLSITHRLTGIFLSLGVIIFSLWLIGASANFTLFNLIQIFINSLIGKVVMFSWTVSLFYHLFNGIRHLAWDIGFGFDLKNVNISGWIVISLSIIFSTIVWILGGV